MTLRRRARRRAHRARRNKLHRHDVTFGFLTQNVQGLAKRPDNVDAWFSSFRRQHKAGALDLILLQETQATDDDARWLSGKHARCWGFDSQQLDECTSLWSATADRSGGVAILRHPYSQASDLTPYQQDAWTPHWMAAHVTLREQRVLVVNVYAPRDKTQRDNLFLRLIDMIAGHDGPVLVGGDFNSTVLPQADRSYALNAAAHVSHQLKSLLAKCELVDVLCEDAEAVHSERERSDFAARTHTYHYTLPSGERASSRLDRWYITDEYAHWIRAVQRAVPGQRSDHDGVHIRVCDPRQLVRVKRPRKVYPVSAQARKLADAQADALFDDLEHELEDLLGANVYGTQIAHMTARWWDDAKIRFRKCYLSASKTERTKAKNCFRKRVQRLDAARRRALAEHGTAAGTARAQEDPTSIRVKIIECKREWARAREQRLWSKHAVRGGNSERAFFARIATKYTDNTVYALEGVHCGAPPDRLANAMADGWRPILAQDHAADAVVADYLSQTPTTALRHDLSSLDAAITEPDVELAIKRCKRYKASGPDELPNDWYRDNITRIVPILTKLFRCWMGNGLVPDSFVQANIMCLRKKKTATCATDYRPIALLNSDYKIFTRVFALRLKTLLPWIIHPHQAGFVPGQSIHVVIETLLALQKMARQGSSLAHAICLQLDFAKAYDSLNRAFLFAIMKKYGFPERVIRIIKALHARTTARFVVNGYYSRSIDVTSGIRQGCPLAPLLFIVALDHLYRAIDAEHEITGVTIPTEQGGYGLKVSGYADDTTLYLSSPQSVAACLRILDNFGAASGLRVNTAKSICVPLGQHAPSTAIGGIPVQGEGDTCRYLGIQVTYVARHCWPNEDTVSMLHRFIKDFVWGSTATQRRRPWVSEAQAELQRKDGGLAVPNIRTELLAMGSAAVSRWATNATVFERAIGNALISNNNTTPVFLFPARSKESLTSMGSTLWVTGTRLVQHALFAHPEQEYARTTRRCAERLVHGYNSARWTNGSYSVDVSVLLGVETQQRIDSTRRLCGAFCEQWLGRCSTTTDGWLLDRRGSTFALSTSGLAHNTVALRDILSWRWLARGQVEFRMTREEQFVTAPYRRSFQRLCFALLYNFPQLLCPPREPSTLWPYDIQVQEVHSWSLRSGALTHFDATLPTRTHTVLRASDIDAAATNDVGTQSAVHMHSTPETSRMAQLWGGTRRWEPSKRTLARIVAGSRRAEGNRRRQASAAVPGSERCAQSSVAQGIARVTWSEIDQLPGLSTYERQLCYRIKAGKISAWCHASNSTNCPHSMCQEVVSDAVQHVFWDCPAAQTLWKDVAKRWAVLGASSVTARASSALRFKLANTPHLAWLRLQAASTADLGDEHLDVLHDAIQKAWKYTCGQTLACIWRHRHAQADSHPRQTDAFVIASAERTRNGLRRMASALRDSSDLVAADQAVLLNLLAAVLYPVQPTQLDRPRPAANEYLLFFDGGSRGNPGPGGSGSVLIRIDPHMRQAQLLWVGSMSYANPTTTNNLAEYYGLLHGMRRAQTCRWQPLHVVGDSSMIITQQAHHRPPKNKRLAALYRMTKRIADTMHIATWSHHYRAYNKMADRAANHAMDSACSAQYDYPTLRTDGAEIQELMTTDVLHWFDKREARTEAR